MSFCNWFNTLNNALLKNVEGAEWIYKNLFSLLWNDIFSWFFMAYLKSYILLQAPPDLAFLAEAFRFVRSEIWWV